MIPAFVEGLRSSVLPCSLTLIVPIVAVAVASRKRPVVAVAVATIGAIVAMWARAAGLAPGGRWVGAILALLTLAVVVVWWRWPGLSPGPGLLIAFVPGAIAGWLWQPCVGTVLGGILESAGERTAASVFSMGSYAVGVLVPAFAIALVRVAVGDPPRWSRPLQAAGRIVLAVVALAVLFGLDNRVVSWLVALSI